METSVFARGEPCRLGIRQNLGWLSCHGAAMVGAFGVHDCIFGMPVEAAGSTHSVRWARGRGE